jgi:hypothetical protein
MGKLSSTLIAMGSDHFTHIFIYECGQALEPAALVRNQASYIKPWMINWEDRLYLMEIQCNWGQFVTPLKQKLLVWVSYFNCNVLNWYF